MPTFFVIFFLLFTCKVPHPLHQLCGPFLHIPIPITIHHLICSLAPIMGLHSSNEVLEAHEPWPPQVEHHIGNDPLCLLRKSAKVGEDGIAVLKSNANILCEELLYSFISHLGPYRLPILWVTGQNEVANAYSWFLLWIKVDVSPVCFMAFQLSSQCLIIDSDTLWRGKMGDCLNVWLPNHYKAWQHYNKDYADW